MYAAFVALLAGVMATSTTEGEISDVETTEEMTVADETELPAEQSQAPQGATDDQPMQEAPEQDAFEAMNTAFASALQQFMGTLAQVSMLPPLSAPHGNGAAYQKFLDIYEGLGGVSETAEDETEVVDVVT